MTSQRLVTVLYPSKEARDMALVTGMEKSVAAGYDRLDQLLTEEFHSRRQNDESEDTQNN